jgi:hypothetical protein
MWRIIVLLLTWGIPVHSGKCPGNLKICDCFWALNPKITSCRANILHMDMKRVGLVQKNTENLVVQVELDAEVIQYDFQLWSNLEIMRTTNALYRCNKGLCISSFTNSTTITSTLKMGKKWTTSLLTSPTTSITQRYFCNTLALNEDNESTTTPISSKLPETLHSGLPTWLIILIVAAGCLTVGVVIFVIYRYACARNSYRLSSNVSIDSIPLYEMPEMSPNSPAVMTVSPVAHRTRSRMEPIAKRTRTSRKDS